MNKNEMRQLVERYFNGETTFEEEKRLQSFLSRPESNDKEWDEIRAVMGFLIAGKRLHRQSDTSPKRIRFTRRRLVRWGVASILCIFAGSYYLHKSSATTNVCVMYAYGKKYTDPQVVMGQMKNSLHSVLQSSGSSNGCAGTSLHHLFQLEKNASIKVTTSNSR